MENVVILRSKEKIELKYEKEKSKYWLYIIVCRDAKWKAKILTANQKALVRIIFTIIITITNKGRMDAVSIITHKVFRLACLVRHCCASVAIHQTLPCWTGALWFPIFDCAEVRTISFVEAWSFWTCKNYYDGQSVLNYYTLDYEITSNTK